MFKLNSLPLLLLSLAGLHAQTAPAATPPAAAPTPDQSAQSQTASPEQGVDRFEISAAYFGSFPSAADANNVHQGASSSGGVLGEFRWFPTTHHGVEFNYGFDRDTELYLRSSTANAVHNDVDEATVSYVFRAPFGRGAPFLSAGGGALIFDPLSAGTATPTPAVTQARAAFVYAVGMDIVVSTHISLRPEYRAFVLRAPTFGTGVGSEAGMYISEMVGGVVWKL